MTPQDFEELPLMLDIHETAKLLRVGHTAIRLAVKRKQLPAVAVGRFTRIPKEALREQLFPQTKAA